MADYFKCGPRVSLSLPHDFLEELKAEAHEADLDVTKLILDIIFKAKKGVTHSVHRANCQLEMLERKVKTLHQDGRTE